MPQEPWHPRKGAKPDPVILLNDEEVHTYTYTCYKKPDHGWTSTTKEQ